MASAILNKMIPPGSRVCVMGLGISGMAAVHYFLRCGAEVMLSDRRRADEFSEVERLFVENNNLDCQYGGHTASFLGKAELILVSPGIDLTMEPLADVKKSGVPIVGELAVAASVLQEPVVAITGTNGKTTVTSLISKLLQSAGKKVFTGGNIGTPLFDYLCLPDVDKADVLVLEVSSFQLESGGRFRPDVALLLNLTPDHLDRHGDLDEYGRIKANIFAHQKQGDTAILGRDDLFCRNLGQELTADNIRFFGHDEFCDARVTAVSVKVQEEETDSCFDLQGTELDNDCGALNSAAAILAVKALGCKDEEIRKGLKSFKIPGHRMEKVRMLDGVTWYNDSKATNTGAVLSALRSLDKNVVLIMGGRDKGDDYTLLRQLVEEKVCALIHIGEAGDLIEQALTGTTAIKQADSLVEAVAAAQKCAVPGGTVLLSPACASFDMFSGYADRGRQFVQAVKGLAGNGGLS